MILNIFLLQVPIAECYNGLVNGGSLPFEQLRKYQGRRKMMKTSKSVVNSQFNQSPITSYQLRGAFFIFTALCFFASPAFAKYSGGTGEPNNPYLISTAADMNEIGANVPTSQSDQKKIAAVCTFYRQRRHADVIVTKFLYGFPTDDGIVPPLVKVVSMYIDQSSPNDLGPVVAAHYKIPVYSTVTDALTFGGDKLAVDGVLLIGEHGDYPLNRFGMKMYPRMSIAEEIFRCFEASRRVVPIFHDKHLSYSWLDSKWIYDRVKELNVPFMAGSSLPVAWRNPPLEHPIGSSITEAVVLSYGGLSFHALDMLQCMLERRDGGETGVASVQYLQGQAVYEAARQKSFSMDLAEAAASTVDIKKEGTMEQHEENPVAIIVNYRDGTKGAVLTMNSYYGRRCAYAARVDGKIVGTEFVVHKKQPYCHFSYLCLNIQQMFLTGKPQYAFERTLYASGILDMAHRSRDAGGKVIDTPFLDVQYKPFDNKPIRPKAARPCGGCLKPWPPEELKSLYSESK